MSVVRRGQMSGAIGLGIVVGLVGGITEMLWIWTYSALAGTDPAQVAAAVAGSIGLEGTGAPVQIGVTIHLILAAALGAVLVLALRLPWIPLQGRGRQLAVVLGALTLVWSLNFLFLLPLIDPSFVKIVPYEVSLASKLLFGLGAAVALSLPRIGIHINRA